MTKPPSPLHEAVRRALDTIVDPDSGAGLMASGRISGLVVREDGKIGFALETRRGAEDEPLRASAAHTVSKVPGVTAVTAVLTEDLAAGAAPVRPVPAPAGPKRPARTIIAIASAKGGVGKSTVAINLAVAASRMGLRVGLLDADIYGPSVPTMSGREGTKAQFGDGKKLLPIPAHGLSTMSMGYLVDPEKSIAWRGPMIVSAVNQMIQDVDWGELDVLFIDTPPGTGEVQLTLVQRLPLDGAVIVSTPQEVALADVRRGVDLFRRTEVPILGVIENMAWFELPDGKRSYVFGEAGAERTANEMGVAFLGALPLLPEVRQGGDEGKPAALGDGPAAKAFQFLADAILANALTVRSKAAPRLIFE